MTSNQTTTSTSLSTGARKNVASNVAVQSNASGITVSNGSNGGLAANYTLTGGTHQVNITKAPVSVAFLVNMMDQQMPHLMQLIPTLVRHLVVL